MTTELKAKDFLLHYIKKEYSKRSKILNNLTSHIECLHKDYLVTNKQRTDHLKTINELVKILNFVYGTRINMIKGTKEKLFLEDFEDLENSKEEKIKLEKVSNLEKNLFDVTKIPKNKIDNTIEAKTKMLDVLYSLSYTVYENELKNLTPNDFHNFDEKLKKLVSLVGCRTISDVIYSYSRGTEYLLSLESQEETSLMEILNEYFIPLYIISKKKTTKNNLKISKQQQINKYESLIGNFFKVDLNLGNPNGDEKQLSIFGFFEYDCVNSAVRTSACEEFLSNKITRLNNIIDGTLKSVKGSTRITTMDSDFKKLYIKNMTIGEIIACDDNSFINDMSLDYAFYQRYSSADYKNVFPEFMTSDLTTKFKIIKYMLFDKNGLEDSGDAGILFQLCKESKNGSLIVSDIIYKNLSLSLQLKISKAGVEIKKEIERLSKLDADDIDLRKQIMLNKNMPEKIKKLALEKLNEMKTGGSEYYKQLLYVKAVVDYPWIGPNDSDIFSQYKNDHEKWREIITKAKTNLQEKVYGHNECKETITELIGKWFSNPKSIGTALALQGPPGVGKTLLAMQLGKALDLPFAKINLGGVEDATVLNGSASVYSGSTYGSIVKKMTEMGKPRCILFFDELDKIALHHGRNEVSDVLIHITDATTNSQFNDKFFQDITFPLNKVLFIFSFNNKEKIDPILLDRMEIIRVEAYSIEDKIKIVNDYLLKEIQVDMGLTDLNIKISDEMITYLVDTYTNEAGVRSIKRVIEKLLRKLNKDRIFQVGPFEKVKKVKTIEFTKDLINKYLPKQEITIRKIHESDEVGIINGLYVSGSGSDGGILPILIYKNNNRNGKFTLRITGNQMKVMKESIDFAFTVASNLVKQKYLNKFYKNFPNGLHLHNPDASKKDGPSAGICTTVAFISKILNIKIKKNIAITGEAISGQGDVGAIGGIPGKLTGAKKSGVKLVFCPEENKKDVEKLMETHKSLFDDNFKAITVKNIKEILEYVLIENDDDYDDSKVFEKTFNSDKYLVDKCSELQKQDIEIEDISGSDDEDNESNCDNNSECSDESENSDSSNDTN